MQTREGNQFGHLKIEAPIRTSLFKLRRPKLETISYATNSGSLLMKNSLKLGCEQLLHREVFAEVSGPDPLFDQTLRENVALLRDLFPRYDSFLTKKADPHSISVFLPVLKRVDLLLIRTR
jgi:hypothetical protein